MVRVGPGSLPRVHCIPGEPPQSRSPEDLPQEAMDWPGHQAEDLLLSGSEVVDFSILFLDFEG